MKAKRQCYYLEGENIAPRTPAEAKALIGVPVTYLLGRDIDKSGRGYFFPRVGTIASVIKNNIAFDNATNFNTTLKDIREMARIAK